METLKLILFFRNLNRTVRLRKDPEGASVWVPSSARYGLVYGVVSFVHRRVDGELDRLRVLICTERRLDSNLELAVLLHESGQSTDNPEAKAWHTLSTSMSMSVSA